MTELSTDWAGAHWARVLWVSRSNSSTEWADIFWEMGAYMVQGLALEASYDGGGRWFGSVRNDDGVVVGSGLHNHLQSSRERNTSKAHSRSTSSANPSPASLSWHSVTMISFSWGKGRHGPRMAREWVGSSGQLGKWIDGGVGGGQGVSGGGMSCGSRGAGVGSSRLGYPTLRLLWNLLLHLITAIVSSALLL